MFIKMRQKVEFYTWAERIASELKKRKVKKHVVHGMWTPSGYFHLGNSRTEIFTPAIAAEALKDAGLKTEFNLFFDDFDDFDKIPAGVKVDKKKFERHLGLPLREVPSPSPKYKNWAEYFERQIVEVVDKFGVKPNFVSSYDSYKHGKYDKAIKIVLEKAEEVSNIWEEVAGKRPKGIPIMAICEKCGRGLTTLSTEYDGTFLHYSCDQESKGIMGCGYSGKIKPEKGNAKLHWRLHWPATWMIFGTTFESGGKDHFTPGGSADTGKAFAEKIFGIQPPLLVGTDFLNVDGKKMAGSVGNVISIADWLEFAEPELLRFMYVTSPPRKVINFDLTTNKFFLLADKYDKAERIYFGKLTERDKQENEKRLEQLKRQYKISQINLPKKMPVQLSYSYAVVIAQTRDVGNKKEVLSVLKSLGYEKIDAASEKRIFNRVKLAKAWIDKYAPETVKIKVVEKVSAEVKKSLSKGQKTAIKDLIEILKKKLDGDKLQYGIYEISKKHNIQPKEFFELLYGIILNKHQGPRLGPFIIAIGIEKVKKLLSQI